MNQSRRRVGRPQLCPPHVLRLVLTLREQDYSIREISEYLNSHHVPTPGGGPRWWPSRVHGLLGTRGAQEMRAVLSTARAPPSAQRVCRSSRQGSADPLHYSGFVLSD